MTLPEANMGIVLFLKDDPFVHRLVKLTLQEMNMEKDTVVKRRSVCS